MRIRTLNSGVATDNIVLADANGVLKRGAAVSAIDNTVDAFINTPSSSRVELMSTSSGTPRVAGTEFVINDNGRVGIGTATPSVMLQVNGTDGIIIPSGTNLQRPATPVFGTMRYNTSIGRMEMYVNDSNGDTFQGDAGWRAI
jgi:hypothetical protein